MNRDSEGGEEEEEEKEEEKATWRGGSLTVEDNVRLVAVLMESLVAKVVVTMVSAGVAYGWTRTSKNKMKQKQR